jgi:hypothetical protein
MCAINTTPRNIETESAVPGIFVGSKHEDENGVGGNQNKAL